MFKNKEKLTVAGFILGIMAIIIYCLRLNLFLIFVGGSYASELNGTTPFKDFIFGGNISLGFVLLFAIPGLIFSIIGMNSKKKPLAAFGMIINSLMLALYPIFLILTHIDG